MEVIDFILIAVYFILILIVGLFCTEVFYRDKPYRKYFLPALFIKLISALAYAFVYKFYYGAGDTINYYNDASVIYDKLLEDWSAGWTLMTTPARTYNLETFDAFQQMFYDAAGSAFFVAKMTTVLSFFTFNNFFATTLVYSAISFTGMWALYTVLVEMYPKLKIQFLIAVFFIPSVVFWGSGIMKDTVTIGCVGWFFYGFYHLLIKKDKIVLSLLVLPITAYLILKIKFYILAAFIPGLVVWFVGHHFNKMKDVRLKAFVSLLAVVTVSFFVWYLFDNISKASEKLLEAFISEAIGFHTWHSFLDNKFGGSGYDFGTVDFTPMGILSKFPASVNVTLFRPYIFEVKNIVMLISSLESTLVLLFTVFTLLRVGVFRSIKYIFSDSFLVALLIYVLIFAFVVGFTSYNFGALVRYKIPCMPFYIALLFILMEEKRRRKEVLKIRQSL